jgi:hypothetical protein
MDKAKVKSLMDEFQDVSDVVNGVKAKSDFNDYAFVFTQSTNDFNVFIKYTLQQYKDKKTPYTVKVVNEQVVLDDIIFVNVRTKKDIENLKINEASVFFFGNDILGELKLMKLYNQIKQDYVIINEIQMGKVYNKLMSLKDVYEDLKNKGFERNLKSLHDYITSRVPLMPFEDEASTGYKGYRQYLDYGSSTGSKIKFNGYNVSTGKFQGVKPDTVIIDDYNKNTLSPEQLLQALKNLSKGISGTL